MFFQKSHQEKKPGWVFLRMRIYDSSLLIACGGRDRDALPILSNYVNQINQILKLSDPQREECYLDDEDGYLSIKNLKTFATQSGWMLIGMLMKDNWFIHKYQLEGPNKVEMIDMLLKS